MVSPSLSGKRVGLSGTATVEDPDIPILKEAKAEYAKLK